MRSETNSHGKHRATNARKMLQKQNGRPASLGKEYDNRKVERKTNMAKNYSGDKAYQRAVRARGGHRTEKDYARWQKSKYGSSGCYSEGSYSLPKKIEDYYAWRNRENKYEGFLVIEKRISRKQFDEIKSKVEKIPFEKICLIDSDENYKDTTTFIITSVILGHLGLDRFLLGQIGKGILKFITFGGFSCWWIIDIFRMSKLVHNKNFELVKSIVSNESVIPTERIPLCDKIKEIYTQDIEPHIDSETIEKIIFQDLNKNDSFKAIESFKIDDSETILFGYDDTLKNSFKSGFVLTEKKLYFTDGNSFTKNTSISVTEINSITFKKKLGIAYICINDTCISITSPIGKDSEKICELLNKAVRILQKEK